MFKNAVLETDRLIIRPLRLEDDTTLHDVVSREEVMHFLPEGVMSLDEVRDIITWLLKCYDENTPQNIKKWTLAVVRKDSSEVIGWCGLGRLDFSCDEIELFCGLSDSYWGRGIAAEACRAVLDYAFSSIGLSRIVAVVDPENSRSRRLIEKIGMQLEKQIGDLPKEFGHYEGFLYYSISRK
ncbi:MAG TPA: GNAT family N-acetyltransferase [Acidobacteriota bacterium]|nr:GNAT family N-acetyltransferase [Acidobacteriota bacterium]